MESERGPIREKALGNAYKVGAKITMSRESAPGGKAREMVGWAK